MADEERLRADTKKKKIKHVDLFHCIAEEMTNLSDAVLKEAKTDLQKLRAELLAAKTAIEETQLAMDKVFGDGESLAMEKYVDEVLKFENRGFKHGWLEALFAAQVTLDLPISFEQEEVEPLESNEEHI
ncbi:hypothetical protein CsSME_00000744 [Camellia sinensis var. sinensis]